MLLNFIKSIISFIGFLVRPLFSKPEKSEKPERIAILLWGGIGNYVLFSPALYGIRERFPDAHLTLCSFQPSAQRIFFKTADSFISIKGNPSLKTIMRLLFLVKGIKPDVVISNAMSPTFVTSFIAFFSGAKVRIGMDRKYRGFLNNVRIDEMKEHEVVKNIRIAKALSIDIGEKPLRLDITEADRRVAKKTFKSLFEKGENRPIVIIQPGSGIRQSFKRWSKEKFKDLAEKLLMMGLRVVIAGTEEEEEEIRYIEKSIQHNRLRILKKRLTLSQLSLFLKNFDLIIANDTSLVHLGAISGVPSVVIYGPTDPEKNKPWGVLYRIVRKELSCSPCYNFHIPRCPYHLRCLRELSVEQVVNATLEMLKTV